jgi:hypothetical protein
MTRRILDDLLDNAPSATVFFYLSCQGLLEILATPTFGFCGARLLLVSPFGYLMHDLRQAR